VDATTGNAEVLEGWGERSVEERRRWWRFVVRGTVVGERKRG
jgi:hypothetical protein